MGDLRGLQPILLCQGLGRNPQKQIPLTVDSSSAGGGSGPLRMDRVSFPA
jgi:hypothetical protein